ncbi:hypothetical protein AVEN_146822-1 [Araneus ventricosus]|uniref:Uncharacterized protein n=1 Tax=Araneus ventricosus TaxID=182803 RepID=A0A4Y2RJ81_ARAVE|nr:hypothetical protein AVEN_146822-1 [Araneus ventricosus]
MSQVQRSPNAKPKVIHKSSAPQSHWIMFWQVKRTGRTRGLQSYEKSFPEMPDLPPLCKHVCNFVKGPQISPFLGWLTTSIMSLPTQCSRLLLLKV